MQPLLHIKSASERPENAFVTVKYDDYWYWIAKDDYASKRVFTFLMLILMLSETGDNEKLPVLTIPTG